MLQGGGALGAYQAGIYEALCEARFEPGWVAGISIGGINAAIIAGNPPEQRAARLREFWEQVSSTFLWKPLFGADSERSAFTAASATWVAAFGVPGFFRPRLLSPLLSPRLLWGARLLQHAAVVVDARALDRFRFDQRAAHAAQRWRRQCVNGEFHLLRQSETENRARAHHGIRAPFRPDFRRSKSKASSIGTAASFRTRR